MTKQYLYVVTVDGPQCGMRDHSLEAFACVPGHENQDPGVLDCIEQMAREHVENYIDVDEWEEENGTEMEYESSIKPYIPEKHRGYTKGRSASFHEGEGFPNIKQDEKGFYVEE